MSGTHTFPIHLSDACLLGHAFHPGLLPHLHWLQGAVAPSSNCIWKRSLAEQLHANHMSKMCSVNLRCRCLTDQTHPITTCHTEQHSGSTVYSIYIYIYTHGTLVELHLPISVVSFCGMNFTSTLVSNVSTRSWAWKRTRRTQIQTANPHGMSRGCRSRRLRVKEMDDLTYALG